MRAPNEHDPLTPSELNDLSTQMRAWYLRNGGISDRKLLGCELENMYRLMETANYLSGVIRDAAKHLDEVDFKGARKVLNDAMKGHDLPCRTKVNGIDYLNDDSGDNPKPEGNG